MSEQDHPTALRPATHGEAQRTQTRPERSGAPRLPELTRLTEGLLDASPGTVARALPDVVRLAGAMIWRTNRWTLSAALHVGDMVIRGAISGQSAQALVEQLRGEATRSARELLGIPEAPEEMPMALRERISSNGSGNLVPRITLRDRMNALLDASTDLHYPDAGHPAYARVLADLAPDEARILRLFAQHGAQPSVDVRTKRPFGVGSELVAPGLTMIGRYAGCRNAARVPAYLSNLFRLGLIWFSREAMPDQSLYDVLEAQRDVAEALRRAGRGTTVRRSIELTAFGRNLCAMTGLLSVADSEAATTPTETTHQMPSDSR